MAAFTGQIHTTFSDESWARCAKILDILEKKSDGGSSSTTTDAPGLIAQRVQRLWEAGESTAPGDFGLSAREIISRVLYSVSIGRVPIQFENFLRQCPEDMDKLVKDVLADHSTNVSRRW